MTDAAAAKEFYSIVTQKGLEKLAKTKVTGKNVNLTHMAVGDGNGNYYTLDKARQNWCGNCIVANSLWYK